MKILITGNMGYVGPCVVKHLRNKNPEAEIVGLDTGYFAHCLTGVQILPEVQADVQYFCDIRNVPDEVLLDLDTVIHLAAISNDPMGKRFERATEAINGQASANLARRAKAAGVRSFVFASSCSMYGSAGDGARTEEDELNPLTAYARSKVFMEQTLQELASDDFVVTSLRFSTACGMSERLRLDLVLNDFVASAVASGCITILSDGSPWRPLIHVKDMARAIEWGVGRSAAKGRAFEAVNVGRDDWNYQIRDLAEACASAIDNVEISINDGAQPDKRSYRVDFTRFRELAPDHQPLFGLGDAIRDLHEGLVAMQFKSPDFREMWFMRLKVLAEHIEGNRLDGDLRWMRRKGV